MINKVLILLLLIVNTVSVFAEDNAKITGKSTWEKWKSETDWDLIETYDYYFPDENKLSKLKQLISKIDTSKIEIIIFATTFCDECQVNIPKLFKILESINFPENQIQLYGLDNSLEEPTGEYLKYDIPSTPFVFVKYDNEIIADIGYPYLWLDTLIEIMEELK